MSRTNRREWLKQAVEGALKVTNGQMPIDIIVHNKEEADYVKKLLKGRRKAKVISPKIKTS